jgi:hypothetical protein
MSLDVVQSSPHVVQLHLASLQRQLDVGELSLDKTGLPPDGVQMQLPFEEMHWNFVLKSLRNKKPALASGL